MRKNEKKVDFTGQKTRAVPWKIARNRVRNGEKREKRRFWSEKGGVGERRKNGLYCRFCNAIRWQNGRKWNFLAIFFSSKSCRECRNALPLHSQSGSNALAREGYALKATRQRKRCCDLWKSYITDCREVQGTIDHEAFFLKWKEVASGKMNCTVKFYSWTK